MAREHGTREIHAISLPLLQPKFGGSWDPCPRQLMAVEKATERISRDRYDLFTLPPWETRCKSDGRLVIRFAGLHACPFCYAATLNESLVVPIKASSQVVRATPTDSSNFAPLFLQMRIPHPYFISYSSGYSNRSSKFSLLLHCIVIDPVYWSHLSALWKRESRMRERMRDSYIWGSRREK